MFHDDNRVCYFDINLDGPGKKHKVHFERTLTDPAFFTKLYLADEYPIRHKVVRIVIPADYPGITVEELNFQSADSLYRWHADMNRTDTDIPDIDTFLNHEVYGTQSGELTGRQRLEMIYGWVQSNIRYLAYEEGERGHRPERPAEVIRKRMGDCKDMALLLSTLLNHAGIESNTAGHFTSKAEVNGDKILLTVSQEFSKHHMPASDWEQMLQLLDVAAQFNTLTLLLEKK